MATYKYKNQADYAFLLPELQAVKYESEFFVCLYGHITIKVGYAWNGCTMAPDFKATYTASMVHDALYQYGKRLGLKRRVADRKFYFMLIHNFFSCSELYYLAVRLFGWLFY